MKRKLIAGLFLLTILIYGLSAQMYLAPMSGSSGVNLASTKYRADIETGWVNGTPEWISNGDGGINAVTDGKYCDRTMIAGGQYSGSSNQTVTVTITSSSGFNFISQSNNAYKRPFELLFLVRRGSSHGSGTESYVQIISGLNNTFEIKTEDQNSVWFDVILVLPGTLSADGHSIVMDNGIMYPLANADDYVADITIRMSLSSGSEQRSVIIPFSGFFDSDSSDQYRDDTMNISIQRTAAASNLNIKNLAETGERVPIASIEMYYFLGTDSTGKNPRMFLSASNDPFTQDAEGFKLLHTSVGYDTPHTTYNSIGYQLIAYSYSESALTNPVAIQDGADFSSPTIKRTFDGKSFVASDNAGALTGSETFIYPQYYRAVSFDDYDTDALRTYYYYWKSDIQLVMDEMTMDVMYSGMYQDTIYFHVIYEE